MLGFSHFLNHVPEFLRIVFVEVRKIEIFTHGAIHTATSLLGLVIVIEYRLRFSPFPNTILGDTVLYERVTLYFLRIKSFVEAAFFVCTITDVIHDIIA